MSTKNNDVKKQLSSNNTHETMSRWYTEVVDQYLSKPSFKKHPKLSNPNTFSQFKKDIGRVYGRNCILFSIDIEAWERNNHFVTEIGISIYDPSYQLHSIVPTIEAFHIRPKEAYHKTNGHYVPNHAANFIGEKTMVLSLKDSIAFVNALIKKYFQDSDKPCCLVGHNLKGDIKWLKDIGVSFADSVQKIDTEWIFGLSRQSHTSLHNALYSLDIPHSFLHNAGNDAYYTLLLALKLLDPFMRDLYELDTYLLTEDLAKTIKKRNNKTLNICLQEEIDLVELQNKHELNRHLD